ncbi:MAG: hypothetical protein CMQ40_04775 [Gammaproteobacteria bacterium]|nr:hypothetical protein [Gammaproteobacteria bacterium]
MQANRTRNLPIRTLVALFTGLLILATSFPGDASGIKIKGTSSAILSAKCLKDDNVRGKRDKVTFFETLQKAKVNAIRRHVANSGISVANAFEAKQSEIAANVEDYLLNPNIRVLCERGTKNLKISVTGELNKSAFDRALALNQMEVKQRSRMTSIFVARRQSELKSFDAKRTEIARTTEISEASQAAEVGADGSMKAEGMAVNTVKTETGGNVTYKQDKVKYATFRPDAVETAVTEIFVSLGYRPINNSQIEERSNGKFNVKRFEEEFASNENISTGTLSDAFDAISKLMIPLLVIGKVDVGAPMKARGNDQPTVVVDVKAQVFRYDGLFYETVASFGPAQIKSTGLSSTAAENNAILEASRAAARQLGAQLQQNNIY